MKSLFIVNPRSGLRRRIDITAAIRSHCGEPFEIVRCDDPETLDAIIDDAVRDRFEVVYAVGGDGTVHEIAKRVMKTPLALGIVPAGSGNGLARHLNIPMAIEKALAACREGVIAAIDTAVVNGRPYFGVMGIGLDAVIAARFASSRVRGLRTYVRVGLPAYARYRPEEYDIEVDGTLHSCRAVILAIANSSQYGNNARIAPLASLQDGLLDVVAIERTPLWAAPRMLLRLFNGTFDRSPGVRVVQGSKVHVRRAAAGPAHIDGEPVTLPAELDLAIRPRSLRVLLPAGAIHI
ncbi:MAG TPA: YegS/Rv2252/BmrU family lipid kinase [Thermoanaerobaculia bacterium]|nr:YegS/Rv2252/BmrU family lipid kinase [Thermoanaerobaculia bacterium]